MKPVSVDSYASEVSDLLRDKLSIKSSTLERALRRNGRLLPRHIRREVDLIAQSQQLASHPKLASRLDGARLAKAHKACVTYLETVDPHKRRSDLLMAILGSVSLAIVGVSAMFIAFLVWRGFV